MSVLLASILDCMACFFSGFNLFGVSNALISISENKGLMGFDTSIESMRSQEFSVGIFYFLVAAIVVFTVFVFMFMLKDKSSKLKKGEKIMFAWILLGVVVAIGFGAAQMLHGYLF